MIPPFGSSGNLPPGVHQATWEEFAERFGTTAHRRELLAGLKAALDALRAAGYRTVYIDGSFVTTKKVAMIKNERQYLITKAQAEKFECALARLVEQPDEGKSVHPTLQKAQADALRSQLADLRAQLEEYEALRAGRCKVLELESFEELPRALIQARIASGLSQKELAERLGLKEQQIQRYEATEYASASLARVMEVIRALEIKVREMIFLPS